MQPSEKVEKLQESLSLILNDKIRHFAEEAVKTFPDYFFNVPGSSTGKYHRLESQGSDGLLNHTKMAVRFAVEQARLNHWGLSPFETDICVCALIIHDSWKYGEPTNPNDTSTHGKYTVFEHPLLSAKKIKENDYLKSLIDDVNFRTIIRLIEKHMGQWNTDSRHPNIELEIPRDKLELLVTEADTLSSKRTLESIKNEPPVREKPKEK